jgi:hypothetical protein
MDRAKIARGAEIRVDQVEHLVQCSFKGYNKGKQFLE